MLTPLWWREARLDYASAIEEGAQSHKCNERQSLTVQVWRETKLNCTIGRV